MKIALAINNEIIRNSLSFLLLQVNPAITISHSKTLESANKAIQISKFDLIIADLHFGHGIHPDPIGWKNFDWNVPAIVISRYQGESYILSLARAGFKGILLFENTNIEELKTAILEVSKGKKYISPAVSEIIDKNLHLLETSNLRMTNREMDLIRYFSDGLTAKEIAGKMKLATTSVETYRKILLKKTKTKGIANLISFAHKNGFIF